MNSSAAMSMRPFASDNLANTYRDSEHSFSTGASSTYRDYEPSFSTRALRAYADYEPSFQTTRNGRVETSR